MVYDLADLVPLTFETGPVPGILANAGTVTLTIGLPDGTTATPVVTNPSGGRYRVDYAPTQAGRHTVRWTATGVNPSGKDDVFDVRAAPPDSLISLADAKTFLNIDGVSDDEELRGFIETATRVVESVVGPVVVRTYTEVHRGSGRLLVLNNVPVLSLTSLAAVPTGGINYVVADLDIDAATGIVRRLDGGRFVGPLRAVYPAGRRIVPATMTMAARVIVAHMWETQRGHTQGRRPTSAMDRMGSGDMAPAPGVSFMVPRRALELLNPDRRMPLLA